MRPHVKQKAGQRLSRIEGQVRGIGRMIEQDAYCIDVLQQLNSISAAIDGLRLLLIDDHMRSCMVEAVRDGTSDEHFEELATALRRVLRA